jgi:hypothetical protein
MRTTFSSSHTGGRRPWKLGIRASCRHAEGIVALPANDACRPAGGRAREHGRQAARSRWDRPPAGRHASRVDGTTPGHVRADGGALIP